MLFFSTRFLCHQKHSRYIRVGFFVQHCIPKEPDGSWLDITITLFFRWLVFIFSCQCVCLWFFMGFLVFFEVSFCLSCWCVFVGVFLLRCYDVATCIPHVQKQEGCVITQRENKGNTVTQNLWIIKSIKWICFLVFQKSVMNLWSQHYPIPPSAVHHPWQAAMCQGMPS